MNSNALPTTATPYGRLLYAIAKEREAWAYLQAPAGQDNDHEQETADTVAEILDGIIRSAHGDMGLNAICAVLTLGPDAAAMVRDGVEILQPDGGHAQAIRATLLNQLSRFCDGLSEPQTVEPQTVAEAASAVIHQRDYHAEHGSFDQTTPRPAADQCFDDWAADILQRALREAGEAR